MNEAAPTLVIGASLTRAADLFKARTARPTIVSQA
jgi:hypothetical protein